MRVAEDASRRDEIIETATGLFLEEGYAATSMSTLARACGIRKASLYHHFASKEALFIACVQEGYGVGIRELEAIRDDDRISDRERMRRALAAIYDVTVSSPAGRMSPLIAEVSRQIPAVARAFYDGFIAEQHAIVHEIIDAGVTRGTFADLDRFGLEHMIFGPVVTLSLSREMFASFDTLDTLFPTVRVRDAHTELILRLLTDERAPMTPEGDQAAR